MTAFDTAVTVPALLFRAGDYPDRGVSVTTGDLDTMVERLGDGGTVPLRLEHLPTVLDPLGTVGTVHRRGAELWGTVTLAPSVARFFAEHTSACFLSATLSQTDGEPGFRLTEVSVVREARVDGTRFVVPAPKPAAESFAAHPVPDAATDALVERFRREGRLTPAMEAPLRELLTGTGAASFGASGSAPASVAAWTRLLAALPQTRTMGDLRVVSPPPDAVPVSATLRHICARLGVPVADAARHFVSDVQE